MEEDFGSMTLDELIASQKRDDHAFQAPEGHTIPEPPAILEWMEQHADDEGVVRLPMESRPRKNGPFGEDGYSLPSGFIPKMRTGTFGKGSAQAKGCRTHGFEFWRKPESGGRAWCKRCKDERRTSTSKA